MSAFFERFLELCEREGTTPRRVAKDIGIKTSTLSMWKTKGVTPQTNAIIELSKYFSVSPEFMIGGPHCASDAENDGEEHFQEEQINPSKMRDIIISTDIDPEWAELEGKMKAGTATDEEASRFMELIENSKKLMPDVLKRLEKIQEKLGALEELNRILDSVEKATPEELNTIARLSEVITDREPTDGKK